MEPENSQDKKNGDGATQKDLQPMTLEDAPVAKLNPVATTPLLNYGESPAAGSVDKSMDLDDFNQADEKQQPVQSNN